MIHGDGVRVDHRLVREREEISWAQGGGIIDEGRLTSLKSPFRLFMISPVPRGVISSDHSDLCTGSAWTAKLVIQLTRADSAYRKYVTLLTWPCPTKTS